MSIPPNEIVWAIIGFCLSLCIFSYLIGDNPLFRFAVHLFIGVSAGVVTITVLYQVLYPKLLLPLLSGGSGQRCVGEAYDRRGDSGRAQLPAWRHEQ